MTNDEKDPAKRGNPAEGSGNNGGSGAAANDLMGLFAPPPAPKQSMDPSLFVPPSETDPLLLSTSLGAIPDISGKISITPKRTQRKEAEKKEEFFRVETSWDDNDGEEEDDDN